MIGMVMGNEHTHYVLVVQTHLAEVFLDGPRRDTGVNEYSPLTRTEIVAVAATTAGKAPEYESVFLHFTKSATKVQQIFDMCKEIRDFF
jgi:hypothetical protein